MEKISRPLLYLIFVSIAAALVWYFEKPTQEKTGDAFNKIFLPSLNVEAVAGIQIEHLINGVKLKKENGGWVATPIKTKLKENLEKSEGKETTIDENWQPVDGGKVATDLDILKNLHIISLAGNNPEKHGYFEVNPVGMQLWLYDATGKELTHLYFGKMGGGFGESYIRKEGDNDVYLTDHFMRALFSSNTEGWKTPDK